MRTLALLLAGATAGFAAAKPLAITGAKVYTSASAAPISHATVLLRDGRIAAVGTDVKIPYDAEVIRCSSCTVMAGFWNCHVHFTEPKWENAAAQPAEKLAKQLEAMLTHSGFTTVVDTASDVRNTVALRRRIQSGEIEGPQIFTAGSALYPPHGIPYYLRDTLPAEVLHYLSQPDTPEEAAALEARNIQMGADILKLFTGSWVERGKVLPMPEPIAKAAADVAHQHHQLVFAHPSSFAGTQVAMESGVDVLAHAPDDTRGIDDAFIQKLVDRHMAMIPTLKLFSDEKEIADIRRIVRDFHAKGGQLMFGTDTGFLTDYDMTEEYRQLALTGLTTHDILVMLTENPARRFGLAAEQGQVAAGMKADLTVLDGDPANDATAFTHVRYTIRDGRVIFSRDKKPE